MRAINADGWMDGWKHTHAGKHNAPTEEDCFLIASTTRQDRPTVFATTLTRLPIWYRDPK